MFKDIVTSRNIPTVKVIYGLSGDTVEKTSKEALKEGNFSIRDKGAYCYAINKRGDKRLWKADEAFRRRVSNQEEKIKRKEREVKNKEGNYGYEYMDKVKSFKYNYRLFVILFEDGDPIVDGGIPVKTTRLVSL
jgi:hypothetical protein